MLSAWSIRCETQPHRRMSSHNVGMATHLTSGRKSASTQGRKKIKKNKSARSQARQRTHARAEGRKPTPTPMQGGRVERGCTQLTRAVRGGDADSPTQYL